MHVIADDIKIGAHGGQERVGGYVAAAAKGLAGSLESQWGMRVSRDKGGSKGKKQGLASHPRVARRMAPQLKKIVIPIVYRVRDWGVHFSLRGTNRSKLVRAEK